jgi:glycosyltransferase involved in cell wall biosynthesis
MLEVAFVIPGDLNLATGGYAYDRQVLAHLPGFAIAPRHVALPGSFPAPSAHDLAETARIIDALPPDMPLLIDGLAYGAMPDTLIAQFRRPIVALVHHPLCLEAGLSAERAQALKVVETQALAHARRVIVTSSLTARTLGADFGVPADMITVAEPGTEPARRSRGSGGATVAILAVGSIVPRKGYDVLVAALARIRDLDWSLTIAGPDDRSPPAVAALRSQIDELGLGDHIALAGPLSVPALDAAYAASDLFVLSSHYEGYGMVLAEAMARGLAIVTTTGGAAADTVPDGAALKVPPGSVDAMSAALRRAIGEPGLRRQLSDAAWQAGQKLPRWPDTTRRIAEVLKEIGR